MILVAVLGTLCAALLGLAVASWVVALSWAKDLTAERARVDDLHSRLAARSLAEYAQFAPSAPPRPEADEQEWVFDDTGLIGAEAGDDGEA